MQQDFSRTILGRTGVPVGRLGLSSSYGAPAAAVERAFERGMNYLYWGSLRRDAFGDAIRRLAPRARERMVVVLQCYAPVAPLVTWSFERGLRSLGLDYADVLLLGLWDRPIPAAILDAARAQRDKGRACYIGVSTHRRSLVPGWAIGGDFDLFHIRYNAVHRGAEHDIFPQLPERATPGIVAFTATSWKQLLGHSRIPRGMPVPTAADCYRFVLSNPAIDISMTGASNAAQMEHALTALDKGPMSEEEMAWMRRVGDAIYGGR